MKKVLPIILLAIFLFNIGGYFIAFKIRQYQAKEEIESEIKAGMNTEDLTAITINKTDLAAVQFTDSNKEMRYKDELFDVVRSSETNKTITYYCINDTKEESLFASLDNHIRIHVAANNKTDKNSKKSADNVIKLYFSVKQKIENTANISSYNYLPFSDLIFISAIIEKNAPPPELA